MSYQLLNYACEPRTLQPSGAEQRDYRQCAGSDDIATSLEIHSSTTASHDVRPSLPAQLDPLLNGDLLAPDAINVNEECQGSECCQETQRQIWQSFWLKRVVIFAFWLTLTVLCISLLALRRSIHQRNGLDLILGDAPYLLKFGPTAILVLVTGLWRQVDYSCKMLQPWENLRKGPTSAAHSVLLDYVSAFQAVAFVGAFRNRDFAVSIAIATFVSLKIAVIFSTSLLVVLPTASTESTTFTLLSDFQTFNQTITIYDPKHFDERNGIDVTLNDDRYIAPKVLCQGILDNKPIAPSNVLGDLTVQLYDLPENTELRASGRAVVHALRPKARCEIGTPIDVGVHSIDQERYYIPDGNVTSGQERNVVGTTLTVDAPTCHLPMVWLDGEFLRTDLVYPSGGLYGYVDYRNCTTRSVTDHFDVDDGDWRWAIVMANKSYQHTPQIKTFTNESRSNTSTPVFHQMAVVLCDIDYTLVNATLLQARDITGKQSFVVESVDIPTGRQHLPGFSESTLNQAVARILGATYADYETAFDMRYLGSLFSLLQVVIENGDNRIESLLTSTTLKQSTETVLNCVSQLFFQNSLTQKGQGTVNGTLETSTRRLHVREMSFWFVLTSLVFSSCGCLFLLRLRPQGAVSCNPSTIYGSASIICRTRPSTRKIFSSFHLRSDRALKIDLGHYQFQTKLGQAFALHAEKKDPLSSDRKDLNNKLKGSWTPLPVRKAFIAFTITLSVIVIVSLEMLHNQSDRRQGIANLASEFTDDYFLYITSIAMLCIATIYNYIDFTVTALCPFGSLCDESVPFGKHAHVNYIGTMPIIAMTQALHRKRIGLVLSNFAAIIGSTLTIVASTLWTSDPNTLLSTNVTFIRADTWNITAPIFDKAFSDSQDLANLIVRQNLSYPAWTYRDLVFPRMNLQQGSSHYLLNKTGLINYEASVTALRGRLTCDTVLDATILYTGFSIDELISPIVVTKQPTGCLALDQYGVYWWPLFAQIGTKNRFLAQLIPMNFTIVKDDQPPELPGCPSFGLVYGFTTVDWFSEPFTTYPDLDLKPSTVLGRLSPSSDVSFLLCYEGLEEVTTDVSFVLESDSVNGQTLAARTTNGRPPVPIESTARRLTNGKDGAIASKWYLADYITTAMTDYYSGLNFTEDDSYIDAGPLFRSLLRLQGLDGKDFEALAGHANIPRLISAVGDVWRIFVAQAINSAMRSSLDTYGESNLTRPGASTQQQTISARALVPTQRIKVNPVAKSILQYLLGTMALCLLGCFFTSKFSDTLAHEPCSIASMVSLIAPGDIVDNLPQRAEWMTEKEVAVFLKGTDWKIRMGWWRKNGETKEFSANNARTRKMISEALKRDETQPGNADGRWRFGIDIQDAAVRELDRPLRSGQKLGWWRRKRRNPESTPLTN